MADKMPANIQHREHKQLSQEHNVQRKNNTYMFWKEIRRGQHQENNLAVGFIIPTTLIVDMIPMTRV